MKRFAVFDIDGTVIRWQLYHAVVQELIRQEQVPAGQAERIRQARMTWKKRGSDGSFLAYESVLIEVYHSIARQVTKQVFDLAVENVFEVYRDQVYTYTRDLIASLKAEGYLLLAISGSHQEIVAKLGDYYGFDEVVGAQYELKDGRYTDRQVVQVYGRKGEILQELVSKHGAVWQESIAVGDTATDVDMLSLVEQPIAFNPDKNLMEVAVRERWMVIVERKNVVYKLRPDASGAYMLQLAE